jgi:hypothetical protein
LQITRRSQLVFNLRLWARKRESPAAVARLGRRAERVGVHVERGEESLEHLSACMQGTIYCTCGKSTAFDAS